MFIQCRSFHSHNTCKFYGFFFWISMLSTLHLCLKRYLIHLDNFVPGSFNDDSQWLNREYNN